MYGAKRNPRPRPRPFFLRPAAKRQGADYILHINRRATMAADVANTMNKTRRVFRGGNKGEIRQVNFFAEGDWRKPISPLSYSIQTEQSSLSRIPLQRFPCFHPSRQASDTARRHFAGHAITRGSFYPIAAPQASPSLFQIFRPKRPDRPFGR